MTWHRRIGELTGYPYLERDDGITVEVEGGMFAIADLDGNGLDEIGDDVPRLTDLAWLSIATRRYFLERPRIYA